MVNLLQAGHDVSPFFTVSEKMIAQIQTRRRIEIECFGIDFLKAEKGCCPQIKNKLSQFVPGK